MKQATVPVFLTAFLCFTLNASCLVLRGSVPESLVSRSSDLKRRFWNDDLQPCIEKYCVRYLRSDRSKYVQCLSKYCPSGLLALPRDLDNVESMLGSNDYSDMGSMSDNMASSSNVDDLMATPSVTLMCAMLLCNNKADQDFWACAKSSCNIEFPSANSIKVSLNPIPTVSTPSERSVNQQAEDAGYYNVNNIDSNNESFKLDVLQQVYLRVCGEKYCSDSEDEDTFLMCVKTKCVDDFEGNEDKNIGAVDNMMDIQAEDKALPRKRRVNDDVSQCIQSYCGGQSFSRRIVCIVQHCHRTAGRK